MRKIVKLKKEDCYCDLTRFYENVAQRAKINVTENTMFDCRRIEVTKAVQEILWYYYREEKHCTDEETSMILLAYGPKATLEECGILEYRVEFEDGFIMEG